MEVQLHVVRLESFHFLRRSALHARQLGSALHVTPIWELNHGGEVEVKSNSTACDPCRPPEDTSRSQCCLLHPRPGASPAKHSPLVNEASFYNLTRAG